jgi:hypothetical protein
MVAVILRCRYVRVERRPCARSCRLWAAPVGPQPGCSDPFGTWEPEEGLTIHAFVANLNNGGYVLVEADDPNVVLSFVSKYFAWNDVDVVPVVDVAESVAVTSESLVWARAASSS